MPCRPGPVTDREHEADSSLAEAVRRTTFCCSARHVLRRTRFTTSMVVICLALSLFTQMLS